MIVKDEFEFNRRLKEIRTSRGMTQQELGEKIGIVGNVISNWEMGLSMPRLALFRDLCIALNCPPGDLLGLSPSDMSGDEYNLLKGYRQLNAAGQYTMTVMLETQLAVGRSDD